MTTPRPGSRADQRRRTEERILDTAAGFFAADGYERTTIRAVASAAGVDPALVMHYFGSKQELFRRVIEAAPVPDFNRTPGQAAEQILASLADRLASEPTASLTLLRSMLTSPEAASAASVVIARYQAQITQAIPADDASLRAAVISAITQRGGRQGVRAADRGSPCRRPGYAQLGQDGPHVLGAVRDHPARLRARHPLAGAVVADQPQAVGLGVTHGAGEQVPGSPVMHEDREARCRSRVLDRDLTVGDPDELWWRANSQTLTAPGFHRPGIVPSVLQGGLWQGCDPGPGSGDGVCPAARRGDFLPLPASAADQWGRFRLTPEDPHRMARAVRVSACAPNVRDWRWPDIDPPAGEPIALQGLLGQGDGLGRTLRLAGPPGVGRRVRHAGLLSVKTRQSPS
jgi:AcrR family transcriptional regulator